MQISLSEFYKKAEPPMLTASSLLLEPQLLVLTRQCAFRNNQIHPDSNAAIFLWRSIETIFIKFSSDLYMWGFWVTCDDILVLKDTVSERSNILIKCTYRKVLVLTDLHLNLFRYVNSELGDRAFWEEFLWRTGEGEDRVKGKDIELEQLWGRRHTLNYYFANNFLWCHSFN